MLQKKGISKKNSNLLLLFILLRNILQWMEGFETFICERVLFHLSWLSKRVDTFLSLLWHDWQKWSWRDCYRSR